MLPQVMPPTGGNQIKRKPFVAPGGQGMMPPTPGNGALSPGSPYMGAKPPGESIGGPGGTPQVMGATTDGPSVMPPQQGFQSAAIAPQGAYGSIGGPPPMTSANEMSSMVGQPTPARSPTGSRNMFFDNQAPAAAAPRRLGADNAPSGAMPPQGGGSTNPAWSPQGGVSPFNASAGQTGIGEFQQFSDNAYNESVRRLDPQFASQQRGFEQDMVNRGIAPGTPAYDDARANFEQSRNDAYAGARSAADQQGLAAQQQAFGQGAINSQGLRELLLGQMGADASRFGATTSANASMHNSNQAAQTAANQLGYQQQQGDFGNLMSLLGFGMGVNGQNNATQGQNYNQNAWMAGQIPGMQQPGNIDVTSGYNNQYNAGLNQSQWQQQQNNSNNQMYAQMFASLYCDRNAKDEIAAAAPEDALTAITGLPYATWTYKGDVERVPHVGTYAQDFNAALGLPANLHISPIDLMGALIGSVQALTARIKELEAA